LEETDKKVIKNTILHLSGGSTPKVVFIIWRSTIKTWIGSKPFNLYWGDERCVPPYRYMKVITEMTVRTLLSKINITKRIIFTSVQWEDVPELEAGRIRKGIGRGIAYCEQHPSI